MINPCPDPYVSTPPNLKVGKVGAWVKFCKARAAQRKGARVKFVSTPHGGKGQGGKDAWGHGGRPRGKVK